MTKELLEKARRLAGQATPLLADCGRYCSHVCCGEDADGKGGVYLFPGEEAFYENAAWASVEDAKMGDRDAKILYCRGECPRDERPLGCRIFPLTADLSRSGQLRIRFDYRSRPICPLIKSGIRGLDPEFVKNVEEALRLIDSDAQGHDFLLLWQETESAFDFRL